MPSVAVPSNIKVNKAKDQRKRVPIFIFAIFIRILQCGASVIAPGPDARLTAMAGAASGHGRPGAAGGGVSLDKAEAGAWGATAASVSYLTGNVALSFAKICLDGKTAIFITLFF
ncbi:MULTISPECIES: hypothetical protein [unclassified Janthinobacterium]|uniref:hypothetical protein n=1 Tax=unclassified Janthinobacterium TaxID=2610881 RepID=UPI001587BEA6|nr:MULTISPECIES: hypothetical protein [unclassified Janthinobacterium]